MQNICVYCASSSQVRPLFFEAAEKLGNILATHDCRLIYGGGHRGLMGKIADTVLAKGGKVTGIIPGFMCEVEWNHTGLTELILVKTMHERKEKLAKIADAAVALPGGCGTMEELLEVITWKRLGIFTKPIIICNIDGYFDPLIEMLNRSVDENFMGEEHRSMWTVVSTPELVMKAIETSIQWDENAQNFAAL
ncbi:MAG: TIGR00730 family Rossman fold protein [Paludibacter sp.]|nr:TIGR00730 family Rossman fold protein [Paludibacter sp.]MDD4427637.1 TIGR00730 family Rossman fold protein [Paludibacter sp.]